MTSEKKKMKRILLTIAFFVIICLGFKLAIWGSFNQTVHDFYFHYANAAGDVSLAEGHHPPETFEIYPPLFKWLSWPFAFSKEAYYLFTVLFFSVVPAILLYLKTKSEYSAWFYFAASSFFWHLDYFAVFAQYLAVIILMVAIIRKDVLTRLILLPLAFLSHNLGLHLLLLYYLVDYGLPLAERLGHKLKVTAFPLFYPVIKNMKGDIGNTGLGINSIGAVLLFIGIEYNIVFMILSFGGLVKERALFIFSFLLILIGTFELRIWWVFSYIALIGLCNYFEESNGYTRKNILAFSLFTLAVQLYCFGVLNIRPF